MTLLCIELLTNPALSRLCGAAAGRGYLPPGRPHQPLPGQEDPGVQEEDGGAGGQHGGHAQGQGVPSEYPDEN